MGSCRSCEWIKFKNNSYCINCLINKFQLYSTSFFLLIPIVLFTKPNLLFNLNIENNIISHHLNFISKFFLSLFALIFSYLLINNFRKRNYLFCVILGYNIIYTVLILINPRFSSSFVRFTDLLGGFKLNKEIIFYSLILI
jgi:hypothetical protein